MYISLSLSIYIYIYTYIYIYIYIYTYCIIGAEVKSNISAASSSSLSGSETGSAAEIRGRPGASLKRFCVGFSSVLFNSAIVTSDIVDITSEDYLLFGKHIVMGKRRKKDRDQGSERWAPSKPRQTLYLSLSLYIHIERERDR